MGESMNKFPLDEQGVRDLANGLIHHSQSLTEIVSKLSLCLRESMAYVPEDQEGEWYEDAEAILQDLHKRRIDFENFRFGQQHGGHNADQDSPYSAMSVSDAQHLTASENGEVPMTEAELAAYFGEVLPKKQKKVKSVSKDMTLEEIEDWERQQDNSNDIYKLSARVKNLARDNGSAALTPVGEALCNVYTHVLKEFYDFAETIQDKSTKIKLINLIRKNEGMPGNLISSQVGTRGKKVGA
jgi:hypothetical protein